MIRRAIDRTGIFIHVKLFNFLKNRPSALEMMKNGQESTPNFAMLPEDIAIFKRNCKKHGVTVTNNYHFILHLHYILPLPSDFFFSKFFSEFVLSYKFSTYDLVDPLFQNSGAPESPRTYRSKIEVILTPNGSKEFDVKKDTVDVLQIAFDELNDFINWICVYSHDWRIEQVSFENLGAFIFWKQTDSDFKVTNVGAFINLRKPNETFKIPTQTDITYALNRKTIAVFEQALFMKNESWRMIQRGDYAGGVVYIQTAVEIFLRKLQKQMNQIDNIDEAQESFSSLIRKGFHNKIGGNWNVTGNEPIGKYWQYCYQLRVSVVHQSHRPTYIESKKAFTAACNLMLYTRSLIANKRRYKSILTEMEKLLEWNNPSSEIFFAEKNKSESRNGI